MAGEVTVLSGEPTTTSLLIDGVPNYLIAFVLFCFVYIHRLVMVPSFGQGNFCLQQVMQRHITSQNAENE